MKKTKLLTGICAFLFVLSFAGCEESTLQDSPIEEETDLEEDMDDNEGPTNPDEEKEKFTVWCPEEISSLTKIQIERYLSQFEGTDNEFPYELVVENVSEGNAVTNVLTDVTAAGDIFFFAQDQLARVVQSGALSAVPDRFVEDVTTRNDDASVNAASVGGTLYVYPVTSDNGYFAYYDSSVLSPEDMKDQTTMIAKVKEKGMNISFEYTSGWYNAAYFFGTGCVSNWETDIDGTFTDYVDTFNSIPDGYDALEGLAELANSGICFDSSDGSDFASNSAVVVSGTWDSSTVKGQLGDDYAACELWSVTVPEDVRESYAGTGCGDRTYHLGSFNGSKLLGVRNNVDGEKNAWSHNIANYLTSEECQLERYNDRGWGPSNLKAQKNEDVAADEAFNALVAQNEYATMQGNYPGSWWDITETIGLRVSEVQTTVLDVTTLESILSAYQTSIEQIISHASSDACYAVVGSLDGSSWNGMPDLDGPYAFTESNANAGTFNRTGVAHGVWETNFTLVGGGCYVNGDQIGNASNGTEIGLLRVVNYNEWTGNWGYNELTDKTGYYDWDGAYGGGTNNNIGAIPGTYHLVFDFSGTTPAITITQ